VGGSGIDSRAGSELPAFHQQLASSRSSSLCLPDLASKCLLGPQRLSFWWLPCRHRLSLLGVSQMDSHALRRTYIQPTSSTLRGEPTSFLSPTSSALRGTITSFLSPFQRSIASEAYSICHRPERVLHKLQTRPILSPARQSVAQCCKLGPFCPRPERVLHIEAYSARFPTRSIGVLHVGGTLTSSFWSVARRWHTHLVLVFINFF
jgi:hypothetical protein